MHYINYYLKEKEHFNLLFFSFMKVIVLGKKSISGWQI